MSTTYASIMALGEPFPFNLDEHGRTMFSINFDVKVLTTDKLEEEIGKAIVNAGLATAFGTDLFGSISASIPQGVGPYIQILGQSGAPRYEHHDNTRYERPSFQIIVRAGKAIGGDDFSAARARARAIWRALDKQRNLTITL